MAEVLCLEDDVGVQQALLATLDKFTPGREINCTVVGCQIQFFQQLMQEKKWDVFILEYHVDKATGQDILRYLESQNLRTPVVFFTSYAKDVERDIGVHRLVEGVVQKPDLKQLAFHLDLVLGAAEMHAKGIPPAQELKSGFWETGAYHPA